ncbi:hypothetical protein [Streptomyces sp. NPDC020983]|uniref:hypothetical protein n=1 Tax=Streptomyces sp. NPDC020983 TaxID=3365106 RepID=UPI0037AA6C04
MTTLAAMRHALAALGPAADHAAAGSAALAAALRTTPDPDPFVPELPPATAHHGPNAARQVARELAAAGHHSHLHAYGETVCLTGQCGPALDALRGLL